MKTKIFAMAAIAAATVLASCKESEGVDNSKPVAVQFASSIAGVQTRVSETTWTAGDAVGIYMVGASGALTAGNTLAGNREYTATAGTTANFSADAANTIYYPLNGDNVRFIAYYPYTTTVTTGFTLPVSPGVDAMYAELTGTSNKNSGTVVNLEFVHKLVKLEFNISNGGGVTEPLSSGITVAVLGQQTTGVLDLVDGSVSVTTGTATAVTVTGGATAEAIVLPNTSTSGMSFTFTNNANETFTGSIPNSKWEGGMKYTYSITLQKQGAVITGTISPWGNGGSYSITGQP